MEQGPKSVQVHHPRIDRAKRGGDAREQRRPEAPGTAENVAPKASRLELRAQWTVFEEQHRHLHAAPLQLAADQPEQALRTTPTGGGYDMENTHERSA